MVAIANRSASIKLVIVFICTLELVVSQLSYAQSPRDQLTQMVEQLQKTPTDNALRERIIRPAVELMPAPAIPEHARERFVMGVTLLKKASNPTDARRAGDGFNKEDGTGQNYPR